MPLLPPVGQLNVRVAGMILADRVCLLHPSDPTAHEIRAVALKVRNSPGDLDEADREIGESERLAPTSLPYFQWRAALAVVRHDPKGAIRYETRASELKRIQRGS